ncbi:chemotaxis protein CheX [Magnetococcales bacterium HHB-1]
MKDHLLLAIEQSTLEIASTMLDIEIEPGPGIAKPSGIPHVPAKADTSVMVGLNGELQGGVRLGCSTSAALYLASALAMMLDDPFTTMEEEAKDAFAELGNMIAGGIQSQLLTDQILSDLNLTPPSLIVGDDYNIDFTSNIESVRKFFRVNEETFYIEVFFHLDEQLAKLLQEKEQTTITIKAITARILNDLAEEFDLSPQETLHRVLDGTLRMYRVLKRK